MSRFKSCTAVFVIRICTRCGTNGASSCRQIVLDFVKVLDQRELRADDTDVSSEDGDVDRSTWEARVGPATMKLCDRILYIANEAADPKLELK